MIKKYENTFPYTFLIISSMDLPGIKLAKYITHKRNKADTVPPKKDAMNADLPAIFNESIIKRRFPLAPAYNKKANCLSVILFLSILIPLSKH